MKPLLHRLWQWLRDGDAFDWLIRLGVLYWLWLHLFSSAHRLWFR